MAPSESEPELNEETLAYIHWQEENPDVWGDQDENGVDLARLRENLKLTVVERLRRNGIGVAQMRQVEEAGKRYRASKNYDAEWQDADCSRLRFICWLATN